MSILDGASVIEKKLVLFPDGDVFNTEEQIQPNGVDLRVHQVFSVEGKLTLPRDSKGVFDGNVQEVPLKDGWWDLKQGVYLVNFLETANIADGWSAIIYTRSTLVRTGIDCMSGLWDTGWIGRLGASLRLHTPFQLQYGARIAQVVFTKSEFSGHRYTGRYQGHESQQAAVFTQ